MAVIVRRAVLEDAPAIANVHVAAWQTTYRGLMHEHILNEQAIVERTARWDAILRQPRKAEAVVAEADEQIVGFALYGPEPEKGPVYRGELHAIYLLEQHQGKGIGRLLLRASAAGLLRREIDSMLVWVLSTNPAKGFYEKLGGQYLNDRTMELSGTQVQESSYGWLDIHPLADLE